MSAAPHPVLPEPKPRTREEVVAWDLAVGLDDMKAIPLYLSYAKRYPEYLLRKVMGQVREVPDNQIKKSRGALFNYMIQQYDAATNENPRT